MENVMTSSSRHETIRYGTANLYQQFPLPQPSTHIRVLDVLPCTNRVGQNTIQARVRVVDLSKNPNFAALSYVWGVDSRSCTVVCGAYAVKVTKNCYAALKHLRQKLGQFSIWIDAVCINQADDNEKLPQMLLMGTIYNIAKTVYIWLGSGTQASDRAMKYFSRAGLLNYFPPDARPRIWSAVWSLCSSSARIEGHAFPSKGPEWLMRLLERCNFVDLSNRYTTNQDLVAVLDREWIRRVWTYQEVLFAANPIVVCGNMHLPWSRLAGSVIFLHHPGIYNSSGQVQINSLIEWAKVVFTRARLLDAGNTLTEDTNESVTTSSLLASAQAYQDFVQEVFRRYIHICNSLIGLQIFVLVFLVIPLGLAAPQILGHRSDQRYTGFAAQVYDGLLIALLVTITLFLLTVLRWFRLQQPEVDIDHEQDLAKEDLVNAIISRKARDPRDKAFALQAILQRLSNGILGPLEPTDSTGQIYRDLCLRIVTTTGSLNHLVPAALTSYPGQPSWVCDWSREVPNAWIDHLCAATREGVKIRSAPALWRWDPSTPDAFFVRAYRLGRIVSLFRFKAATDIQLETETAIHLENLENLLAFKRIYRKWEVMICHISYFAEQQTQPHASLPDRRQLTAWIKTLYCLSEQSPADTLSFLRGKEWHDQASLTSMLSNLAYSAEDLSHTHVMMCNYLAKTNQVFFSSLRGVSTGGGDTQDIFVLGPKYQLYYGLCTNRVEEGDAVLAIPGLSTCLITRKQYDHPSMKLVSPAVIERIVDRMLRFAPGAVLWSDIILDGEPEEICLT